MSTIDCPAIAAEDGVLQYAGAFAGSWANCCAATGGSWSKDGSSNDASYYLVNAEYNVGSFFIPYCARGFLSFDLSSVPPGAEVSGAVLHVKGYDLSTSAGGSVALFEGTQGTGLSTADWTAFGSTELMTRVNFSSLTGSGWNDFTLNSSALTLIESKLTDGEVRFCVRTSHDVDASGPSSGQRSALGIRFGEYSTSEDRPYLTLTYTAGTTYERSTSDSWAWSDSASRVTFFNPSRDASDAWAWSDVAAPYARAQTAITVKDGGKSTLLSGDQAGNSATLTVIATTGFASSGTLQLVDVSDTRQQTTVTYTGKTGTTFTGCSGGSAHTFPSTSWVVEPDSSNHFPIVTPLDTSDRPVLMVSYTAHGTHSGKNGGLRAKKSTDGGQSWGSELTIVDEAVRGVNDFGVFGHTLLRCSNGTLFCAWYENSLDYATLDSTSCFTSRSTDNGVTWDTPVAIPNAYGSDEMACGPAVFEHGGNVYLSVYGLPAGDAWTDYTAYCKLLKTTDKGATEGNWSTVGTVATTAQTGGDQNGECGIVRLDSGRWYAMMRVESSPLSRWSCYSDDEGATWTGHELAIDEITNLCGVVVSPEGLVFSQGGDISGYGGSAAPITYYSLDQGDSFPVGQRRLESADITYTKFNGSDFKTAGSAFAFPNLPNTYSAETSDQDTARVWFKWYVGPPFSFDEWAWSDTAAKVASYSRSTSDAWAWSDAAVQTPTKNASDAWAWSDSASQTHSLNAAAADAWAWSDAAVVTSVGKSTADAWAWSETATGALILVRRASDAWAWSEAASATTAPGRSTSDAWAWSDSATGQRVTLRSPDDAWAWSDSAARQYTAASTSSDVWAWLDAALGIHSVTVVTSDTWLWTDSPTGSLQTTPGTYSRTSADVWLWVEAATETHGASPLPAVVVCAHYAYPDTNGEHYAYPLVNGGHYPFPKVYAKHGPTEGA